MTYVIAIKQRAYPGARWQVLPARFSSAGAAHAAQRAVLQRFHLLQALYLTFDCNVLCATGYIVFMWNPFRVCRRKQP